MDGSSWRPTTRRLGRRWTGLLAMALAASGGLVAAEAATPTATGGTAEAGQPRADRFASDGAEESPEIVTLENGARVSVTRHADGLVGVQPLPAPRGVQTPRRLVTLGDRTYLLPSNPDASTGRELAQYELTRATDRHGPDRAAANGPTHTLTVNVRNRDGEITDYADVMVMDVNNLRSYLEIGFPEAGQAEFTVPAGDYAVIGTFNESTWAAMVAEQELQVSADTEITLSADAATTQVRFPKAMSADPVGGTFHYIRAAEVGGSFSTSWMFDPGFQLYIEPSAAPAIGDLSTGLKATMRIPRQRRLDDLVTTFDWQRGMPREMDDHYEPSEFADVTATYYSDGRDRKPWLWRSTMAFIPGQGGDWFHGWELPTPSTRHEYYLADPVVRWFALSGFNTSAMDTRARHIRVAKPMTETWLRGPMHPGAGFAVRKPPTGPDCPACRTGDVIRLNLARFTDTEPDHRGYGALRNPWVLRRDDTVVERGGSSRDTVEVPAGRARYTLALTNAMADEFRLSSQARAAWGFDSATSDRMLPLLIPRYTMPVDRQNRLPAGKTGFRLSIPRLGSTQVKVKLPMVKVSYNGGEAWTRATVVRRGPSRFRIHIVNPEPGDAPRYGSLLVQAEDRAGNTVRAGVTRAWRIRA